MLRRIRVALGRESNALPAESEPVRDLAGVMPPIASEALLPKFEAEFEALAGKAWRAATLTELEDQLKSILAACGAKSVVLSRNPLLGRLGLAERLRSEALEIAVWPAMAAAGAEAEAGARNQFRELCFSAGVGITGMDFALAETGSLVVTSASEGSQLSSLAPPVHVALYRREHLVASLDEVLHRLPHGRGLDDPEAGRSVVFVSGTSRTADIEQILIRGVHGPGEVHAILVEDSCLEAL